ncbi:hypothetical protein MIND_00599500 [Mycena indigotica]|uniref:Uncharacterized protein n=1 Tax=Mycena indigotica TaxID=2126181 RepID=A0A8H6SS45_9AGAR|nr:uncharacterized protein MIND_00599500 [Mycena indigotica]KAF7303701.1 hypothetical protein MIND_00599500 [Mycena indigotica]
MLLYGFVIPLIHFLARAHSVTAIGVLLPLYVYPGTNCAAWSAVNSAISSHISTQWYIIINPNSGPGNTDTLYQGCVASLASSNNRITMGYINTRGSNVEDDINKYANWPVNARPKGIYFDFISPTSDNLNMYTKYVSFARGKGFSFIGLDSGQNVPDGYLALGNLINTYQASYSSFQASSLTGSLSKQSITLENAPASDSYSTIIKQLDSMGVAAVYITNEGDSSQAIPARFSAFVDEVANPGTSFGGNPPPVNPAAPTTSGNNNNSNPPPNSSNPVPTQPPSHISLSSPSTTPKGTENSGPSQLEDAASRSSTANAPGKTFKSDSPGSSPDENSNQDGGNTGSGLTATHHSPPVAAIVGGILGAAVVILCLFLVALYLRRRKGRFEESGSPRNIAPFTTEPRRQMSIITDTVTDGVFTNRGSVTPDTSPEESSAGAPMPPSRRYQTQQWTADIKQPIPEDAASASYLPSSSAQLPSRPESSDPFADLEAATVQTPTRTSFISAFSAYTALSGSTIPAYPGANTNSATTRDSMPPPAYA